MGQRATIEETKATAPPPPEKRTTRRNPRPSDAFQKTGVPDGYTGESVLVECHTCGMGIGATLGELKIPAELGGLADRGRLACEACGHTDVTRVRMTEAHKDELDLKAMRQTNALLEEQVQTLQSQLAEAQRRGNQMQPASGDRGPSTGERGARIPEPESRSPDRGQHK